MYIGHSSGLVSRLGRHNGLLRTKNTSFTKKQGGPWKLIYREECVTRKEAMGRERQLKSAKGRQFVRSLIQQESDHK